MTKSLFNTKDVAEVRQQLTKEQENLDGITGLPIPDKQHVLDHDHESQYVRSVLHRQTNAALGKIENIWKRYLSTWYPGKLSDFLRQSAAYLEKTPDERWYHPAWRKKITSRFNKLKVQQQNDFLMAFSGETGTNAVKRKVILAQILLDKNLGYDTLKAYLDEGEKHDS